MRTEVARRRRRALGLAVVGLTAVGLPLGTTAPVQAAEAIASTTIDGTPYPGDPEAESGLVEAEDTRLDTVRTIDSLAAVRASAWWASSL